MFRVFLIFILFLYSFEVIAAVTISNGKIVGGTINGSNLETNNEEENSESASSTSQNEEQLQEDETVVTVENLPQWCKELPQSDFAVYACGIGNSSNLNI